MKTTVLVLAISSFSIVSCKRDLPERTWTGMVTATIDSIHTTFSVRLKVQDYYSSISKDYNVVIEAYEEGSGNKIEIMTSDTTKNVTGQYCEDGSTNSKTARLMYERKGDWWPFMSYNSSQRPATVILTVLEPDKVQGTFSGDVVLLDYIPPNIVATSTKKSIKDGRFELRLQ